MIVKFKTPEEKASVLRQIADARELCSSLLKAMEAEPVSDESVERHWNGLRESIGQIDRKLIDRVGGIEFRSEKYDPSFYARPKTK